MKPYSVALVFNTSDPRRGTGIARYALELTNAMREFEVQVRTIRPKTFVPSSLFAHVAELPLRTFLTRETEDILHVLEPGPVLSLLARRGRRVLTVHDLTSLLIPESSPPTARLLYKLIGTYLPAIDAIIAVSSLTKACLIDILKVPEHIIHVVPHGVSQSINATNHDRINKRREVVGYVGEITTRKRFDILARGFRLLEERNRNSAFRLVACGQPRRGLIQSFISWTDPLYRFTHIKHISNGELAKLLQLVDVLVIPSEMEGFGLPILEAQKSGVPVIIMRDAYIPPEVSKECIIAEDEEHLCRLMERLLYDDAYYRRASLRGIDHAKKFSWARTASSTLRVYEQILS